MDVKYKKIGEIKIPRKQEDNLPTKEIMKKLKKIKEVLK